MKNSKLEYVGGCIPESKTDDPMCIDKQVNKYAFNVVFVECYYAQC